MAKDDEVIDYYLNEIKKIPLLTPSEELELAKKAKNGDISAKEKIVKSNLRFVITIAKKYQNHGLDLEDLISEGNIGLLIAIEKFEPSKGYKFISYAVWWIRQSITRSIRAGSFTRGGAEDSSSVSALPRKAAAVCSAMASMRSITRAVTSRSKVRIVPSITASWGMILGACPADRRPTVTTTGVLAATSRAGISCRARQIWAAMEMGSTPVSGIAP